MYRPFHTLEDIRVRMRILGKKSVQSSEMVNVISLPAYEFVFKYFTHKGDKNQANIVCMEIY
jgi:hypothetical protein